MFVYPVACVIYLKHLTKQSNRSIHKEFWFQRRGRRSAFWRLSI